MPERRGRNSARRRRGNDASGAFDATPGSSRLKFSVVEIREFERVVGDNPSCSSGVPVSIGWNHGKTFTMNLEDFEKARPPRRAQMDLVLTRGERHRLLVEWGASGQDVIEAIRMIIRVKNQRRQTVNNLGSYDRVEEVFENISRSVKNMVCRSSTSKVARKLREDSERAATAKKMPGNAASFAANATLTASSGQRKSQDSKLSSVRHASKPPREVSVHKDFDNCSNSDTGDEIAIKKMSPKEVPEEFPGVSTGVGKKRGNDAVRASPGFVDNSDDLNAYDDVDDVSNPQSHDHHRERVLAPKRAPVAAVGRTVDI